VQYLAVFADAVLASDSTAQAAREHHTHDHDNADTDGHTSNDDQIVGEVLEQLVITGFIVVFQLAGVRYGGGYTEVTSCTQIRTTAMEAGLNIIHEVFGGGLGFIVVVLYSIFQCLGHRFLENVLCNNGPDSSSKQNNKDEEQEHEECGEHALAFPDCSTTSQESYDHHNDSNHDQDIRSGVEVVKCARVVLILREVGVHTNPNTHTEDCTTQ